MRHILATQLHNIVYVHVDLKGHEKHGIYKALSCMLVTRETTIVGMASNPIFETMLSNEWYWVVLIHHI